MTMTMTTAAANNKQKEYQELEQQVLQLQRNLYRDRLSTLVPHELFARADGSIDLKAHQQEIEKVIDEGYGSGAIKDDQVVETYSAILREIDEMRKADQIRQEQRERTTTIEALRSQGLGNIDNLSSRNMRHYSVIESPREYAKAVE